MSGNTYSAAPRTVYTRSVEPKGLYVPANGGTYTASAPIKGGAYSASYGAAYIASAPIKGGASSAPSYGGAYIASGPRHVSSSGYAPYPGVSAQTYSYGNANAPTSGSFRVSGHSTKH
jgi:hypothetical protein